jgi:hypothetical protein
MFNRIGFNLKWFNRISSGSSQSVEHSSVQGFNTSRFNRATFNRQPFVLVALTLNETIQCTSIDQYSLESALVILDEVIQLSVETFEPPEIQKMEINEVIQIVTLSDPVYIVSWTAEQANV